MFVIYVRPAIQNYAWGCKGGGLVATSASVNGLPVDPNKEYLLSIKQIIICIKRFKEK